jgi:hypothetical protein
MFDSHPKHGILTPSLIPPIALVSDEHDGALRLRVVAGAIVVLKAIQSHADPRLRLIENRMAIDIVCQVADRDAG